MTDKLVFYKAPDCEFCAEAKDAANEIAEEFGMRLEEQEATKTEGKHADVPAVCIVDEDGRERCVIGFEDTDSFKRELRQMLVKRVAV